MPWHIDATDKCQCWMIPARVKVITNLIKFIICDGIKWELIRTSFIPFFCKRLWWVGCVCMRACMWVQMFFYFRVLLSILFYMYACMYLLVTARLYCGYLWCIQWLATQKPIVSNKLLTNYRKRKRKCSMNRNVTTEMRYLFDWCCIQSHCVCVCMCSN